MDIKVLVADDDEVLNNLICDILKKQGYADISALNGEEALKKFFETPDIDLVILDVMMPIFNGWEVLARIRELSDVPIIMLTALGDEHSEIKGLKKGADDYIAKPFSYKILTARIEVLIRKVKKEKNSEIVFGKLCLNSNTHKVFVGDTEIFLNNKEYKLLLFLIKNKGVVLSRDKILFGVWGYDFDGDERTIDTHIKTLRSKLLESGECIKTVRGSGYVFEF